VYKAMSLYLRYFLSQLVSFSVPPLPSLSFPLPPLFPSSRPLPLFPTSPSPWQWFALRREHAQLVAHDREHFRMHQHNCMVRGVTFLPFTSNIACPMLHSTVRTVPAAEGRITLCFHFQTPFACVCVRRS